MKKLSYEYKLPSRSIAEVHERFEQSLLDHQKGRAIVFQGRKLSGEAFANAILLHFLDRPKEEQARILSDYVPRFEAMVLGEPAPEPPTVGETVVTRKSQGRRRKSAG